MNWGIIGILFVLIFSSVRLAISSCIYLIENYKNMTNEYWIAYISTCLVFLLGEGRTLHKKFVPSVIERHNELCNLRTDQKTFFHIIFAPLYCTGHLPVKKSLLFFRSWTCTFLIITLIIVVKNIPIKCRIAVNSGVSMSLFFASISLIYQLNRGIIFFRRAIIFSA